VGLEEFEAVGVGGERLVAWFVWFVWFGWVGCGVGWGVGCWKDVGRMEGCGVLEGCWWDGGVVGWPIHQVESNSSA